MCRVNERIYIKEDGTRSTFEETFPCDKARNGKLCSNVKRRTTEYHPKKGAESPGTSSPPSANPPTPTGTGSLIVQQPRSDDRRYFNISRTRPEIIIDFGSKRNKGKKYSALSTRHASIAANASDNEFAIESPGSEASYTFRTGLPEGPLPPQAAYVYSDAYSEAENAKQVRFELGRAESRAKERAETAYAEKEKQRSAEREEVRRRKEKEHRGRDREDEAAAATAKSRKKDRLPPVISNSSSKRPGGSRGGSMTPAQQEEQRRLLAAELDYMKGESRSAEAREREERAALLQQQLQDPSHHDPRPGGTDSYVGRSRTPSLYATSDDDSYDPRSGRGKEKMFGPSGTSDHTSIPTPKTSLPKYRTQASFDVDMRDDSAYSSYTARSGSSAESTWSNTAASAPVPSIPEDDDREDKDKKESSNLKEVRVTVPIENNQSPTLHQTESKSRPRQTHKDDLTTASDCTNSDSPRHDANVRSQQRRRPSTRRRNSISSSIVRPVIHAAQVPSPPVASWSPSHDSVLKYLTKPMQSQPMVPKHNMYEKGSVMLPLSFPKNNRSLSGQPLGPPTPDPSPGPLALSTYSESQSPARQGRYSPTKSTVIVHTKAPDATEKAWQSSTAESQNNTRKDDLKKRAVELIQLEDEVRREIGKSQKSSGEINQKPLQEDSSAITIQSNPPMEPQLGPDAEISTKLSTSKPMTSAKEPESLGTSVIRRQPKFSNITDARPKIEPNVCSDSPILRSTSGIVEPLQPYPSRDHNHKGASKDFERMDSASPRTIEAGRSNQIRLSIGIQEVVNLLPSSSASEAPAAPLHTSPVALVDSTQSHECISESTVEERMSPSSRESFDNSDVSSEIDEVHVEDALMSAMSIVKNLLLRELLTYALPDATVASGQSTSSSPSASRGSASQSLASSSVKSQSPPNGKRSRGGGREPSDGDGDNSDDDDDRPKKKGHREYSNRFPQRRLKCPFYQRCPDKYTKAACRGSGFVDMAKLKDHIKRVHTQPLRCSRCWLEMDSDEAYSEHLQQERVCTKQAEPADDRIRPHVLKRLDFKKAPYSNARNVEEKWRLLFKVLFPADSAIPSPYEHSGMSPQLERALYEALEEELTRELALVIEPIMTRIKGCIPAIIERCREKLSKSTSSPDDEVVFTPQSTPPASVGSSGQGGCVSTSKQRSPDSVSVTYPACDTPSPKALHAHNMAQAVRENVVEPETFCVSSFNDASFTFAEESMTGRDKRALDPCGGLYQCSQGGLDAMGGSDIPGLGHGLWNLASFATQPEDLFNPPGISKAAPATSDQSMNLEPWQLAQDTAHPVASSWSQQPQTRSLGDEANGSQIIGTSTKAHNLQGWESFMRDFDLSDHRF